MRRLNLFFDVDNTLILWNGKLRNHVREVFDAIREDGHHIYIWSGVGIRRWDMNRHQLHEYVRDYFVKPLDNYYERAYRDFKVNVPIHFAVDDHRGVVDAFGGYFINDSPKLDDREMLDVLAAIREFAAQPGELPGMPEPSA